MKHVIRLIVGAVALGGVISAVSAPVGPASSRTVRPLDTPCACPYPDWPDEVYLLSPNQN